ncbi:unnamed protein product [Bursaphelenchus xylophilus]|uniref:(pine wood nematode) hypothetical protein n=1 Tax=Bursaphelenchus xylophilus TaxID=6326 RepID=A0A1I7RNE8_BURXY|nr:unnamed protein product [Bursaphelenchus xylophilus]CAG9123942.1 unnamed protein product [Bursaphelenchus xylophilus]
MADSEALAEQVQANVDETAARLADELAEQIQRQKDALGGFKATKVKSSEKEEKDDKSEEQSLSETGQEVKSEVNGVETNGANDLPEIPTVTEGDENINDSLKSLAGSTTSTFDTDEDAAQKTEVEEDPESKEIEIDIGIEPVPTSPEERRNEEEAQTTPLPTDEFPEAENKSDGGLSASDTNPALEPAEDENTVTRQAYTPQTDISDIDAQKLADAQANYMLPSAFNYTKKPAAENAQSDSDSNSDIVINEQPCKCDNIRKDPKIKTKVCNIL